MSRGPIGTASRSSTGPVSSPASIAMIETPVSASPAMIARWIGAAPRQRGSSEAWMLRQPRAGAASTARRQDQPVGDDHRHLGPERGEGRLPRRLAQARRRPHRQPERLGPRLRPGSAAAAARARPAAAAGCRRRRPRARRPTSASSAGTAKSGVPMKTSRKAPGAAQARAFSLFSFLIREVIIVRFTPLR